MPIKVYKVADIIDGEVVFSGTRRDGDVAVLLTNISPPTDPIPESSWKMDLVIAKGTVAERRIQIDLAPILSRSLYSEETPIFIFNNAPEENKLTPLVYFRDRLFLSERPAVRNSERAEVVLRVKKSTYDEEAELSSLRAAVANIGSCD